MWLYCHDRDGQIRLDSFSFEPTLNEYYSRSNYKSVIYVACISFLINLVLYMKTGYGGKGRGSSCARGCVAMVVHATALRL